MVTSSDARIRSQSSPLMATSGSPRHPSSHSPKPHAEDSRNSSRNSSPKQQQTCVDVSATSEDAKDKETKEEERGLSWKAWVALVSLVGQNASLVMTTRYASAMRTGVAFLPSTLVVCTEILKIFISLFLISNTDERGALTAIAAEFREHKQSCLQCLVPALMYTVGSNFLLLALANLEVTLFQVCSQSKVLITAGWSIVLLDRKFSPTKWLALVVLTLGIITCSLKTQSNADGAAKEQSVAFGLTCIFCAAMCASFGGVYFEKLLKKDPRSKEVSLWMRNFWLSLSSLGFAIGGVFGSEGAPWQIAFFQGYDRYTWAIIWLQALGGFVVALCVKHADNVLKGFATAFSIMLCAVLSFVLFGFRPNTLFGLGVLLVAGSTVLYSRPDTPAK